MAMSIDEILAMEDKNWKAHTPSDAIYEKLPDGIYNTKIGKVVMKVAKSGKLMLTFDLVIISDRFKNKHIFVNASLEGEGLKYTKDKVFICGLKLESLKDLKTAIQNGAFDGIMLEVATKTNGENQNTFFRKRLDVSEASDPTPSQDVPPTEDEEDTPW